MMIAVMMMVVKIMVKEVKKKRKQMVMFNKMEVQKFSFMIMQS